MLQSTNTLQMMQKNVDGWTFITKIIAKNNLFFKAEKNQW